MPYVLPLTIITISKQDQTLLALITQCFSLLQTSGRAEIWFPTAPTSTSRDVFFVWGILLLLANIRVGRSTRGENPLRTLLQPTRRTLARRRFSTTTTLSKRWWWLPPSSRSTPLLQQFSIITSGTLDGSEPVSDLVNQQEQETRDLLWPSPLQSEAINEWWKRNRTTSVEGYS